MTPDDLGRRRARQLAAQAAESGDPAGWFETLYAEARDGQAVVPWDDGQPNPHLTQWAQTAAERGAQPAPQPAAADASKAGASSTTEASSAAPAIHSVTHRGDSLLP